MANAFRFSPSTGWDQVRQIIGANSQLLLPLAGVFFLVPSLIIALFGPVLLVDQTISDPNLLFAEYQRALAPLAPWLLIGSLVQLVGQLAMLAAIGIASRPTVGEALTLGLSRLGYLVLANIVLGVILALGIVPILLVVAVIGAVTGSAAIAGALGFLAGAAIIFGWIYAYVRFSLLAIVLVAEDARWPIPLLRRSWQLTRNNALPIFVFYFMVAIVFLVLAFAIGFFFGLIFVALGFDMTPGATGATLNAVLSGVVSAAGTTIFTVMQVAIYRQLSGHKEISAAVFD
jgi:hypothetical protein